MSVGQDVFTTDDNGPTDGFTDWWSDQTTAVTAGDETTVDGVRPGTEIAVEYHGKDGGIVLHATTGGSDQPSTRAAR